MRKVYFNILTLSFFLFMSYSSWGHWGNVKHDHEALFETQPNGKKTFNALRALGVDSLHKKGITGKGVNVAFISCFDPAPLKALIEKGAIHPPTLQDKTFINPEEQLDQKPIEELKENMERIKITPVAVKGQG